MSHNRLSNEDCLAAVELVKLHGGVRPAARAVGMPETTLRARYHKGLSLQSGNDNDRDLVDEVASLRSEIKQLQAQLEGAERDRLTSRKIRKLYLGLAEETPEPPRWLGEAKIGSGSPGVPSVMLSDLHWGERVFPDQIHGVNNRFDLKIAHDRLRRVCDRVIDLCFNHVRTPEYPGLVVNLGGDMVTGDIHKELMESNDRPTIPVLLDLLGALITTFKKWADKFGRVVVFCVIGNHDRNTPRKQFKNAAYTSLSWMLYNLLELHFQDDPRFVFIIPDGFDAYYDVMGVRYLLTHGDNLGVRGGDGHIGLVGPVIRGALKVKKQYAALGRSVDMVLMGHWHTFLPLPHCLVNGSLKGYDEFAMGNRFDPEPPIQALFFTHPRWGMSSPTKVFADDREVKTDVEWCSWPSSAA